MTLFRLTIVQDISTFVDLEPGEDPLHVDIVYVDPHAAFPTPDDLEEYGVAFTEPVTCMGVIGADGKWHEMATDTEPEYVVMAHYSDEV